MPRILAFDIGIKNLAWCCGDLSGSFCQIRGWANENIITGSTAEENEATNRCSTCSHKAGFWHASTEKGYCVRHCPPLTPALRDLSGTILKKMPPLAVLKGLAGTCNPTKADMKNKTTLLALLEKHYCFPKAPPKKIAKLELEALHEGIRNMVLRNYALFITCTEILLENQPVYKNPVMKSIQMMLYATLRDLLRVDAQRAGQPPKLRLVHASKKTTGATKGDEGYSERKGASEARVLEGLRGGKIQSDTKSADWFSSQAKKSDLADCLCMVLDSAR
jgi:hypothetical protein